MIPDSKPHFWRTGSKSTIIWMVEQLGQAMMPLWAMKRMGITQVQPSQHIRVLTEVRCLFSTTTAPALTAYGAYLAEVIHPAERGERERYLLLIKSLFSCFFNGRLALWIARPSPAERLPDAGSESYRLEKTDSLYFVVVHQQLTCSTNNSCMSLNEASFGIF